MHSNQRLINPHVRHLIFVKKFSENASLIENTFIACQGHCLRNRRSDFREIRPVFIFRVPG
jgi:hypothetical protein